MLVICFELQACSTLQITEELSETIRDEDILPPEKADVIDSRLRRRSRCVMQYLGCCSKYSAQLFRCSGTEGQFRRHG